MNITNEIQSLAAEVQLLKERERLLIERARLQARANHWPAFEAVCANFDVSIEELMGRRKFERVADARQVAMCMVYDQGLSMAEVGQLFSRDHGTVYHARQAVKDKSRCDGKFAKRYEAALADLARTEIGV